MNDSNEIKVKKKQPLDCIAVVVMEIDVDIKTIHLFVYYCVGDIDRKTDTIFLKLRRSGQ